LLKKNLCPVAKKERSAMELCTGKDQKGIALVVALVMLLVLTMIGISSIGSSIFETKIAGNERTAASAFYSAGGGVDIGISQLPATTAYSGKIGSDENYRSGSLTSSSPQPSKNLGIMTKPGYESSWDFTRFQVNATGESFGALRELEVQVSFGPYGGGTLYNN
jgi:Tfp pilus assembly protein PilX